MSGYKQATVNISQEELNRLRQAESRLRELPQTPPPAVQQISQQSIDALNAGVEELRQRQAVFARVMHGFEPAIRDLEANTNRALVAHEASAMKAIEGYAGCLWNHIDQVMDDYSAQFDNSIKALHREQQDVLAEVSRQVRRMDSDTERKYAIAEEWLAAATHISDFIQQMYAHEQFLPGRMDQLERQMEQVRHNLEMGLSEAVIVASQQLYLAFSDMRVELERLQNEWRLLYQTAWEAAYHFVATAEECQEVLAVDLRGNDLPYRIDVNYWSDGRLSELIAAGLQIRESLEDTAALPGTETFLQMLQNDIPELFRALEETVLDARITALNSQLRINIADLVVQALQEQGFSLEISDYRSSDMRLGFGAQLSNMEGNKVVVQIDPAGDALGANELHIESLDSQARTEHELQQRWYEINRSLAAHGVQVGPFQQGQRGHVRAPRHPAAPDRRQTGVQNPPSQQRPAENRQRLAEDPQRPTRTG